MIKLLVMTLAFVLIGAATAALCRLLRLNPVCPKIGNPRRSAICALVSVALSMLFITLIMVANSGNHQHAVAQSEVREFNLESQVFLLIVYFLPMGVMLRLNREGVGSTGLTTRSLWKTVVVGLFLAATALSLGKGGIAALTNVKGQLPVMLLYFGTIGFGEELLFRGYLQTRMIAWLGQARGWVAASAVMALAHIPSRAIAEGMDLPQAVTSSAGLMLISMLCGFVMLRTGSVVAPTIFHAFLDWPRA